MIRVLLAMIFVHDGYYRFLY